MSGRDRLGGNPSDADEVYLPGERFQPHPPINWRAEIRTIVLTLAILAVLDISGLDEVLHRYVPTWAFGLVFIAFGLVAILRPGAVANTSRFGAIVYGSVVALIGALITYSYA
jgi:hypothetical protein